MESGGSKGIRISDGLSQKKMIWSVSRFLELLALPRLLGRIKPEEELVGGKSKNWLGSAFIMTMML